MIKRCTHIFLICIIFFNATIFAQTAKNKLYVLESDETDKPKILALYQNNDGLILCGTTKGLFRFDGFDFSAYPSKQKIDAAVTAIFETNDNRTLIGFENGNIAELKNNIIGLLHFEEGFPKVAIKSIVQDSSGVVWLGTAGEGIYFIKNDRLYNINEDDGLTDNYIYKLAYSPQLGIAAASDRGINFCSLKGSKKYISTYTSKNGLPDNIVRSIFLTNKNELWLGMQDAGIAYFKEHADKNTTAANWNYGQVNDLLISASKIYVATEDSALMIFDNNNSKISFNNTYTDKTISKTTCLLKDREGNIWVAGDNQLLRTAKTSLEEVYKLTPEQAAQIHCLHHTNDSALWFNIPGGLTRLFKKDNEWQGENFALPDFSNTTISAIYESPGDNIWVGSLGKGITVFNHKTKTQLRLNDSLLANNNTITITGDSNTIWISGLEGVIRATQEDNKYTFANLTDTAGIGNKYVYDILCDKQKRIWFATDGDGISTLNNDKFYHLKNKQGYTGNVVYKIIEDNYNNIWYTTYDKGIIKYDGRTFTGFTTSQGLSDMSISGLVNAGDYIAVIHKNIIDIIDPKTNKITYLDRALMNFDINTDLNACTNDKDGNIYFVSGTGIYKYAVSTATVLQPTVTIDRVELFLQNITGTSDHKFSYRQNNLNFFFTGVYYSEPEKVQYQYKLDEYDKEWINTKDREKNFPNLPPGTYTFRVRVSLNKNFANASEATFSFVIEKPFWHKGWFFVIAAVAIGILLYLLIKQREKRITNLNTLKNEKIQSQLETLRNQVNPHFLFNSLNTLVSEIETNPEDAVVYVEKIADFYRSIIQHRDKDLIPLQDELNVLSDYTFLQEKRFASGLDIKVNIDPAVIASSYIPPLVLQMLVENAIKHNIISRNVPLRIEIKDIEGDCLAVRNNINKKLQPERRSGLGLQNIQKRYALLQVKKVTIESDEDFFTVKIPLIKS
jgi:ligand-binding sensor domain-containing protein